MKYKYKILWFEDYHEQLKEQCEPPLRIYLESLGFDLTIQWEPAKLTAPSDRKYEKYDLIVTDLNLSETGQEDTAGVEILNQIREYKIFTDVLIYSSSPDLLGKAKAGLKSPPERVSFCAGHGDLPDKVQKLIELGIRKVQNLENIRGLVITEAIDLENQMGEIAHQYFSRLDRDRKRSKISRTKGCKADKIKFAQKKLKEIRALKASQLDRFCTENCITAHDRFRLLSGAVKDSRKYYAAKAAGETDRERLKTLNEQVAALTKIAKDLGSFDSEVIAARNTLAHVKERAVGGTIALKGQASNGREITINQAWCVEMRKVVRKHAKNLSMLSTLL